MMMGFFNFSLFFHIDNILVPTELEIVRKETFNNWYKARTYFLANTLTTTPIHVSRFTFPFYIENNFYCCCY